MNEFMVWLYARCKPLVEARWFEVVISCVIFMNPLAILPQTIAVFTAPSVTGISVPMWFVFAGLQTAFTLYGIKMKDFSIFASMLASFIQSITIIIVVSFRS